MPYCSLDIETSDFDPANGEVIEIGMVFFEVREHGVEVLREYQSVFKPSKPVSPRILALTNIRQEELDSAPLFREKSEEIQEMVSGAVVLGHNIGFDTKFLEGFGIKFSGLKVDTLDLAQVLLPTLKSYNLEALMNYLGVGHKDAHRALADAKACVTVLEKLVGYCATFPKNLRENLAQLLQGNSVVDELALLLKKDFPHFAAPEQQLNAKVATAQSEEVSSSLKASQEIVSFPLGVDHHSYVYGALAKTREKVVLVVPDRTTTYKLWQSNIAEPVFANDDLFNEKLFEKNLKLATTPEQQIFFAKMLVWKNLNWQTRSLVDVNFAFAGGQFKSLVSYGSRKKPVEQDGDAAVLVTDYASFIANGAAFKDRKAVILDINSFESALTNLCSRKVSWSDFTYRLKQLQADESVFADVDLYFGLASMYFRKLEQEQAHLLIDEKIQESDEFAQFSKATLGFAKKIEKLNKVFASEVLERYVESLKEFLVPEKNTARWVEMYEGKMSLNASPIDLHDISAKKLGIFSSVIFTCSLGSDALVGYFADRLNLKDFKIKTIGQQAVRPKFTVSIQPEKADKLLELTLSLDAPAAVLVGSSGALRDFYEAQYLTLGEKFKVSAQTYSGGTNKLLDNFSMNGNGLFLGTNNFILKQANRKLKVKNLVITRLPFEQFNHPLFAIQAARYQNQFADFSIPRALYNFHAIINFFYSDELEKIYILDAKINKEYGKYFTEYLRSLPFVEIG